MNHKMLINHKIDFVEGAFNTDSDELVCVKSWKYCEVLICVKGSMNVPIAKIKLHSNDRYVDAQSVFQDACNLGDEIVKRWNSYEEKPCSAT